MSMAMLAYQTMITRPDMSVTILTMVSHILRPIPHSNTLSFNLQLTMYPTGILVSSSVRLICLSTRSVGLLVGGELVTCEAYHVQLCTGSVPAIFIMESIMDHVARTLDMDVDTVKKMNLYKQGDVCPIAV